MARIELTRRLEALEAETSRSFTGYAVVLVEQGQTLESAKTGWIAENGPLDGRQWVVFNFGGLDAA